STDTEALFEAERNIANSSPLLQSGPGGILDCRNRYQEDPYLKLWTALVLQKNGNYSRAITELLEAINFIPDNFRIAWYLAQVAEKAGNIKLAKEILQNLIKVNPSFTEAKNMISRIDVMDKDTSTYKEKLQDAINAVNELRQMDLLEEANSTLLEFIEVYKDSPDLLNLQAEIKHQMGQIDEARNILFNLARLFPEHPRILNNLGAILRNDGNIEEAMDYLIKALKFEPDNRSATLNLADILVSLEKYEEAINILSSYLKRNSDDEEINSIVINLRSKHNISDEYKSTEQFQEEKNFKKLLISDSKKSISVPVATSIAPKRNMEQQINALLTWKKAGFSIISFNSVKEIQQIQPFFPDITFVEVSNTGEQEFGKPYIYLTEILNYFRNINSNILGLVNSDIYLNTSGDFLSFICTEASEAFVFGSRMDVESLEDKNGTMYTRGFDFFFFDKSFLSLYPSGDVKFCLGLPWWDYWFPFIAIRLDLPVKKLVTPVAYHVIHKTMYSDELYYKFSNYFIKYFDEKFIEKFIENTQKYQNNYLEYVDSLIYLFKESLYKHIKIEIPYNEFIDNIKNFLKMEADESEKYFTGLIFTIIKTIINDKPLPVEYEPSYYPEKNKNEEEIQEGIDQINELRGLGLLDEAFSSLSDLLLIYPDSPALRNLEGEFKFQFGLIDEAKKSFLSLVETFPVYGQALNNLGVIYLNEGDMDKAFYYYKKALEANKDDIVATLNLADLFVTLDKCEEAEKLLSSYLERNPDAEQVSIIINSLKEKISLKRGDIYPEESTAEIKEREPEIAEPAISEEIEKTEQFSMAETLQEIEKLQRSIKQSQNKEYIVSAIVSCYNSEKFLRGCLQDLELQTIANNLEIIVVNSGSQQNEKSIVEEFQSIYDNIVYIHTEERETIYKAWNRAIMASRGKYITNANTDDRHRPDALGIMSHYLDNHPSVDVVYGDQLITHIPNETFSVSNSNQRWNWPEFLYSELEKRCMIGPQPVWRKSLHDKFGLFREEFFSAGDYEFWMRIGKYVNFSLIPQILGLYYKNPYGIELSSSKSMEEAYKIWKDYGVLDRGVTPVSSIPVSVSPEELNKLPFRDYKSPIVSVIVPTYNRPDMIVNTLNSILNQTYQDFEIIVINDGGIEIEHIIKHLNRKKKITYIRLVKNMERSVARNAGVKIARGKYIAYLDDDDIFYPDHLKILVEFLETTDCKVAYTDAYKAYQNKQNNTYVVTKREIPYSFDFDCDRILVDNFIPILCIMHEKSCMEEVGFFNEKFTALEDMDLWIRMSRKFHFAHINKVTCEFSWRDDGTTTTTREPVKFRQTLPVIYNKYKEYTENKLHLLQIQKKVLMNFKEFVSVLPLSEQNIDSLFAAGELSITFENTDDARFFYKKILEIEPYNNIAMEKLKSILKPSLVSIIILTFNQLEHTKICLESIKKHTPEPYEIIIVDNGSTDGTVEYLKEYIKTCDNVMVIANSVNRGFSAGNNQGISIAKGEYILLLNNDTVVTEGWLKNMLSVLQIEPMVGITGPVTNNISGPQKITEAFYETLEEMESFASKWIESHKGQTLSYPRVVGFCLLTRKSVIDLIGCLDERFATGNFEDDDFCVRAAQAGYGARIVMDSFVHHTGSQTFKGAKINYIDRMMANWKLFKEKWGIPADAT
ncbi:MAG: glycosyltransferase, partial [Candidatus Eremiobacterota bacterium]